MKMGEMISTGAMIIVGIIALKAFGGVKGITSMIGGIGDLLGTGGAVPTAGAAPTVGIIGPGTIEQVAAISGMELPEVALIAETQEIESTFDTLQTLSLVAGPIGYVAAPLLLDPIEEGYKADVLKTYVERTAAILPYTPSPDPIYQPSEIVPADPGHPATDPFLGGR